MKDKIRDRKRKIMRRLYAALSLSTGLFMFQCIYGTNQDMAKDIHIRGTVMSGATNFPIAGIKVSLAGQDLYSLTNDSGKFEMYTIYANQYQLQFQDVDSVINGIFDQKDTILKLSEINNSINIKLNAR